LLLKLSLTLPDIPISQIKNLKNPLSQFNSSETNLLMKKLKFQVKTMMESSEKIPNGFQMEVELPLLLMLSISDYQDSIFIILKLIQIPSFLELSESIMLNQPKVEPLTVSLSKMMKMITGNSVPLMEAQLLIGSAPYLKFLDYLALKKEKVKPPFKKSWSLNLY